MWMKMTAVVLMLTFPAGVSAGPIAAAAQKAALEFAQTPAQTEEGRGRFWTAIALIAAGGVLATLGAMEIGDDDDDEMEDLEDQDDSDDGEDSDGWGDKALLGGGVAAAAVGGVMLFQTRTTNAVVSVRPNGVSVRHTIRF
jgi:hypothetical protein